VPIMPAHRTIELRFIRRSETGQLQHDASLDDLLKITKLGENLVRAIYTERSIDGTTVDVQTLSYQQCLVYIYRIFNLLTLDEDPFESVQLFLPAYPTVLLKVETLRAHIPQLMEALASTCVQWPAIGRRLETSETPTI
jgi:hypothetical protein